MLRKCCFVLLAIFLRQYGPAPQVVAAALILVAALSAELQNLPYQDDMHDHIETIGIQACLLQLLVALLCNLISDDPQQQQQHGVQGGEDRLGPKSTVLLILVVFGSTIVFFVVTIQATFQSSKETKGIVGIASRWCGDWCGKRSVSRAMDEGRNEIDKLGRRSEHSRSVVVPAPALTTSRDGGGSGGGGGTRSRSSRSSSGGGRRTFGRAGTIKGSLRYNVKVAVELKKAKDKVKAHEVSLASREQQREVQRIHAKSRLANRLQSRSRVMKKAEERKPAEKVSEELEEEPGRHLMQEKKTALALHVKLPKPMTPSSQLTKIQAEKEAV